MDDEKWNEKMNTFSLKQIKYLFSRTVERKIKDSMKPEYEKDIIKLESQALVKYDDGMTVVTTFI